MKARPPKIPVRMPMVAKVIPRSLASAQPREAKVEPTEAAVPWPPVKPEARRMPKPGFRSGTKAVRTVRVKAMGKIN